MKQRRTDPTDTLISYRMHTIKIDVGKWHGRLYGPSTKVKALERRKRTQSSFI